MLVVGQSGNDNPYAKHSLRAEPHDLHLGDWVKQMPWANEGNDNPYAKHSLRAEPHDLPLGYRVKQTIVGY
jgi:hypothetical protein